MQLVYNPKCHSYQPKRSVNYKLISVVIIISSPGVKSGGASMFMLGPKSSFVMAMVLSSLSIGGAAACAMAVLFFSSNICMIGPCSGKPG